MFGRKEESRVVDGPSDCLKFCPLSILLIHLSLVLLLTLFALVVISPPTTTTTTIRELRFP